MQQRQKEVHKTLSLHLESTNCVSQQFSQPSSLNFVLSAYAQSKQRKEERKDQELQIYVEIGRTCYSQGQPAM